MTITANSVQSTTIADAIKELSERSDIQAAIRGNGMTWDTVEEIATHIVTTDTDWTDEQ
ncbi:MAG TPA: hypothetical protein PLE60_12875 [Candidatus Latescibacteria bacterium]|nr:hypothetical protein [Candidatus Latescibacterota bacterium]